MAREIGRQIESLPSVKLRAKKSETPPRSITDPQKAAQRVAEIGFTVKNGYQPADFTLIAQARTQGREATFTDKLKPETLQTIRSQSEDSSLHPDAYKLKLGDFNALRIKEAADKSLREAGNIQAALQIYEAAGFFDPKRRGRYDVAHSLFAEKIGPRLQDELRQLRRENDESGRIAELESLQGKIADLEKAIRSDFISSMKSSKEKITVIDAPKAKKEATYYRFDVKAEKYLDNGNINNLTHEESKKFAKDIAESMMFGNYRGKRFGHQDLINKVAYRSPQLLSSVIDAIRDMPEPYWANDKKKMATNKTEVLHDIQSLIEGNNTVHDNARSTIQKKMVDIVEIAGDDQRMVLSLIGKAEALLPPLDTYALKALQDTDTNRMDSDDQRVGVILKKLEERMLSAGDNGKLPPLDVSSLSERKYILAYLGQRDGNFCPTLRKSIAISLEKKIEKKADLTVEETIFAAGNVRSEYALATVLKDNRISPEMVMQTAKRYIQDGKDFPSLNLGVAEYVGKDPRRVGTLLHTLKDKPHPEIEKKAAAFIHAYIRENGTSNDLVQMTLDRSKQALDGVNSLHWTIQIKRENAREVSRNLGQLAMETSNIAYVEGSENPLIIAKKVDSPERLEEEKYQVWKKVLGSMTNESFLRVLSHSEFLTNAQDSPEIMKAMSEKLMTLTKEQYDTVVSDTIRSEDESDILPGTNRIAGGLGRAMKRSLPVEQQIELVHKLTDGSTVNSSLEERTRGYIIVSSIAGFEGQKLDPKFIPTIAKLSDLLLGNQWVIIYPKRSETSKKVCDMAKSILTSNPEMDAKYWNKIRNLTGFDDKDFPVKTED